MRSVPGGATGGGIGAGTRAAARLGLGAALVFFLAATFLGTAFLRSAALGVAAFFFFFVVLVLAFFLVALSSTSTLKTATVRENDASFVNGVNGLPNTQRYHAPSAPKNQFPGAPDKMTARPQRGNGAIQTFATATTCCPRALTHQRSHPARRGA